MFEQTCLFVIKQNIKNAYNVHYVFRTVCSNQLAEAVFQRCSCEKVISKTCKKLLENIHAKWLHAVPKPFISGSLWSDLLKHKSELVSESL